MGLWEIGHGQASPWTSAHVASWRCRCCLLAFTAARVALAAALPCLPLVSSALAQPLPLPPCCVLPLQPAAHRRRCSRRWNQRLFHTDFLACWMFPSTQGAGGAAAKESEEGRRRRGRLLSSLRGHRCICSAAGGLAATRTLVNGQPSSSHPTEIQPSERQQHIPELVLVCTEPGF